MKTFLSALILLFLISCAQGQVQYLQIQLDPVSVARANFFLNVLASQVQTFNWRFANGAQIANTLANTLVWLRKIRDNVPSGNLVDGSGNAVSGSNNVVIGNRNRVTGTNNWVFVSGYQIGPGRRTIYDSVLAIGNYQIDLTKIAEISRNPSAAISMIDTKGYDNLCTKNVATSFFFTS
jgi:hypothetical protein